jgi:hypothetical protein
MNVKMYRAIAVRDGRWWFVQVPGEQGLYTQVRRLDQAVPMLREVISLMRDVPEGAVDVTVEPDLNSLGEIAALVSNAVRQRDVANETQKQAGAVMRQAIAAIRSSGFTSRDAATLLGVSPQRVSQIEHMSAR